MDTNRRRTLTFALDQYQLPNGLQVVLQRDATAPLVAVNLWYRVGSKDEMPGRTGLAHLFEHLMFEGSANHDDDYFRPLQEAGASVNGSTSHDRTQYHEVAPANFLDLALWMEAERMANLLPALTAAKLANQKSVVLNERKQRYENQPYGRVGEEIGRALYAPGHPYSWPVIGWTADIEAATLDDVRAFFAAHYHPGNATLCLAGDFDLDAARSSIDQRFGMIPGRAPTPVPSAQGQAVGQRVRLQDKVALERLDILWHTGPRFSPDEAALDVAAEVLAGRSKDSRLRRRLLIDERLVRNIAAGNDTMLLAGRFHLRCHALPGVDLRRIEAAIVEEVVGLTLRPPTDEEIERVRRDFEHSMYSRIETVLGRSQALCHRQFYRGIVEGDAIARELEAYLAVRPEDVARVASKYLRRPHTALEVVPGAVAAPTHSQAASVASPKIRTGAKGVLPGAGPQPELKLPHVEWLRLDCGLQLAIARTDRLPRVDVDLLFPLGSVADPPDRLGINRVLAEMLDEGTLDKDTVALAKAMDRIGARLGVSCGMESSGISLQCLADKTPESLALLGEILTQPRFAADDLQREKSRLCSELAHRRNDPDWLADEAFDGLVYQSDHPYARSAEGNEATLASIQRDDLAAFHTANVVAAGATMIAVGCCRPDEFAKMVDRELTGFLSTGAKRQAPDVIPEPTASVDRWKVVERAGSPQSALRVGCLTAARNTPDYFALILLNTALGGQFTSRLNARLREEKGYTYGARCSFNLRRRAGDFVASADVQASATLDALRDMVEEIRGLSYQRPIDDLELAYAKTFVARRFPARFETVAGIGGAIAQLALFDLPRDFFSTYLDRLAAVTLDEVNAAARMHLSPSKLRVAVAGDPAYLLGIGDLTTY